jgi:hypothetical protein
VLRTFFGYKQSVRSAPSCVLLKFAYSSVKRRFWSEDQVAEYQLGSILERLAGLGWAKRDLSVCERMEMEPTVRRFTGTGTLCTQRECGDGHGGGGAFVSLHRTLNSKERSSSVWHLINGIRFTSAKPWQRQPSIGASANPRCGDRYSSHLRGGQSLNEWRRHWRLRQGKTLFFKQGRGLVQFDCRASSGEDAEWRMLIDGSDRSFREISISFRVFLRFSFPFFPFPSFPLSLSRLLPSFFFLCGGAFHIPLSIDLHLFPPPSTAKGLAEKVGRSDTLTSSFIPPLLSEMGGGNLGEITRE